MSGFSFLILLIPKFFHMYFARVSFTTFTWAMVGYSHLPIWASCFKFFFSGASLLLSVYSLLRFLLSETEIKVSVLTSPLSMSVAFFYYFQVFFSRILGRLQKFLPYSAISVILFASCIGFCLLLLFYFHHYLSQPLILPRWLYGHFIL